MAHDPWCYDVDGGNNWDLHAVFRFGCGRGRRVVDNPPPPPPPQPQPQPQPDYGFSWFVDVPMPAQAVVVADRDEVRGEEWLPVLPDMSGGCAAPAVVDELCNTFLAPSPPPPPSVEQQLPLLLPTAPASPLLLVDVASPVLLVNELPPAEKQPARATDTEQQESSAGGSKTKKKKKDMVEKMAMRVREDAPAADSWAWRKYGQKPIKGSPYPRGYYKCSSSRNCPARKQVERCREEPSFFVLTYTGKHNHEIPAHRNSLAGTSRHKQVHHKNPRPRPVAATATSPTTPLRSSSAEHENDHDDDLELDEECDGFAIRAGLVPPPPPPPPAQDVTMASVYDDDALAPLVLAPADESFVFAPMPWHTAASRGRK